MKFRILLTLSTLAFVSACASQGSGQSVKITQATDKVILSGGPACSVNKYPDAVAPGETHRCFFPTTGSEAPKYATADQRAAAGRQLIGRECSVFEPLSEQTIASNSTPPEPIVRVGFACR